MDSGPPPLRVHQREALEALASAWRDAEHPRAWRTWVGEGRLLAAAKPEGAGILASFSGTIRSRQRP